MADIAAGTGQDLALASYPKSGNTWLRFIVFCLLHRRAPKDSFEIDRLIDSDVAKLGEGRGVIKKTHYGRDALAPRLGPDSRVIYVYRHPLDVMQSALHYATLTGELPAPTSQADRDAWVARYIAHGGNPLWHGSPYFTGGWGENVDGWLSGGPWRLLVLKYEDLIDNPRREVAKVAEFLGVDVSGGLVEACVAATSFTELKAFEEREIDRATATGKTEGRFTDRTRRSALATGARFFRTGRAGSYADVFTPEEIDAAWRAFSPQSERLGYAPKPA